MWPAETHQRLMMLTPIAALLILRAIVVGADCPLCDPSSCPTNCDEAVPDPCGCCPIRCASSEEGDLCSEAKPCRRDLACASAMFGHQCLCRVDKRMVCGTNNVTYSSICQMNKDKESNDVSIQNWGPCQLGPKIAVGPNDTRAELGKPIAMECEAKGFPVPIVAWFHTGKDGVTKILPGDDQQVAVQIRGGPEQLMITSWVQIVEARTEDEGFYSCEASSIIGTAKAEATLIVRDLH